MRTSHFLFLWVPCFLFATLAPALGKTRPFLPPEDFSFTYRVTHTEMQQTTDFYDVSELAYTIHLRVLSRDDDHTTCSFVIDSVSRTMPAPSHRHNHEAPAFPGRGTIVLNSNGTVLSATIEEYLVQPSFEESSNTLADGISDGSIFNTRTSFSIPAFADNALAPGDTVTTPIQPFAPRDSNEYIVHYRLADTTVAHYSVVVYGITQNSTHTGVYEQPQYTYRENKSELREEKLWWSNDLHTAVLYSNTTGTFHITSLTGQLQRAQNAYEESSIRLELLSHTASNTDMKEK